MYICPQPHKHLFMFSNCEEIVRRMNKAGKANRPFLFAFNFELTEGFFIEDPLQQQQIIFDINGISNAVSDNERRSNCKQPASILDAFPESAETYRKRFHTVKEGLLHGNSFLTNLTIKTPIKTPLTLKQIFDFSHAPYRICVPKHFVCFSPEGFVKIKNGRIYSYPMKGTIDGSIANAQQIILNDYKEKAEHYTIVDLIRNDLNQIATDVNVRRFRYIDTLRTNKGTILQVSSEIEGTLPNNYEENIGTLLMKLLPAGSISGAPKRATLQLIRNAEKESRGYYSGIAGYFDGHNLDSGVLIRYIEESEDGKLFFHSGGGITVNSECESEYHEAIQKVYLPF